MNIFSFIFGGGKQKEQLDEELVKRVKLLAKHGTCLEAARKSPYGVVRFCDGCMIIGNQNRPDYWSCIKEGESAKRWLKEHGIKE